MSVLFSVIISILFLILGIIVVAFANNDNPDYFETGNMVIGTIIITLSVLFMVYIFLKKYKYFKSMYSTVKRTVKKSSKQTPCPQVKEEIILEKQDSIELTIPVDTCYGRKG